jgi:hypothetical protein
MNTVRKDVIFRNGGHFLVSTVELGGWGQGYETMVFRSDTDGEVSDWMDLACDRYDTHEEALRGHRAMTRDFQPPAPTSELPTSELELRPLNGNFSVWGL